jgi:hypothetical protein
VWLRPHSPPFSRSIPTVLRPDQKQKETAPVLCLLKIKELLAQFLDRGARGIKPLEADGGVVKRSRRLLIDTREAHLIFFV